MKTGSSQRGFTLLEVLIALTLVTTLMALAWSLLSTFVRLETRARKTIGGLEITRTLVRQLQDDLDQIVFLRESSQQSRTSNTLNLETELGNALAGLSSIESEASLATQIDNEFDPNDLAQTTPLRRSIFTGSSDSVSFLISRNQPAQTNRSRDNWLVVTYEWSFPSNTNASIDSSDENRLTGEPAIQEASELDGTSGLTEPANGRVFVRRVMSYPNYLRQDRRSEEDAIDDLLEGRETIEIGRPALPETTEGALMDEQVDAMPEISRISFRYFDGQSWSNFWSDAQDSLPLAIEVIFDIQSETDDSAEVQESSELQDLDFGDEIEIGRENEPARESAFESGGSGNPLQINPDFDSDSRRALIRLGTRNPEQPISDPGSDFLKVDSRETGFGPGERP